MSSVTRQKSATENHKCRVQLDKRVERVNESATLVRYSGFRPGRLDHRGPQKILVRHSVHKRGFAVLASNTASLFYVQNSNCDQTI